MKQWGPGWPEAPLQLCHVHWDTLRLEATTQADRDVSLAIPLNCSPTASSGGDGGRLLPAGMWEGASVFRWAHQIPPNVEGPWPRGWGWWASRHQAPEGSGQS